MGIATATVDLRLGASCKPFCEAAGSFLGGVVSPEPPLAVLPRPSSPPPPSDVETTPLPSPEPSPPPPPAPNPPKPTKPASPSKPSPPSPFDEQSGSSLLESSVVGVAAGSLAVLVGLLACIAIRLPRRYVTAVLCSTRKQPAAAVGATRVTVGPGPGSALACLQIPPTAVVLLRETRTATDRSIPRGGLSA